MKILAIANAFPKFKEDYSGNYIYKQLESLSLKGVEVEVISPTIYVPSICSRISAKMERYAMVPDEIFEGNIHIFYPKITLYNQMYNIWIRFPHLFGKIYRKKVVSVVEKEIVNFKPDVIYITGIFFEGTLGLKIKRTFGIPILFIENSIPRLNDALKHAPLKKIYTEIVEESDAYICVSKKQKEILENEGIKTEKVYILPNGFQLKYPSVKRKNSDCFRIITVGFLDDRKGYPNIFECIAYLKKKGYKIHYTIVGDGSKKTEYLKRVKELDIEEICTFTGRISHEEVEVQLLQSDLFVLPSQGESFGIAYLEAMACHVPVIMTEGEGISDFLENEKNCIMVTPENVKQLCYYMDKAYKDREWLVEIAEQGCNKSKEFGCDKNVEGLLEIIKNSCATEIR